MRSLDNRFLFFWVIFQANKSQCWKTTFTGFIHNFFHRTLRKVEVLTGANTEENVRRSVLRPTREKK